MVGLIGMLLKEVLNILWKIIFEEGNEKDVIFDLSF